LQQLNIKQTLKTVKSFIQVAVCGHCIVNNGVLLDGHDLLNFLCEGFFSSLSRFSFNVV